MIKPLSLWGSILKSCKCLQQGWKEIMFRLKRSTLVIVVFEMKGLQDDCCVFSRRMKERSDDKVIEILGESCEGGMGSFWSVMPSWQKKIFRFRRAWNLTLLLHWDVKHYHQLLNGRRQENGLGLCGRGSRTYQDTGWEARTHPGWDASPLIPRGNFK